MDKAASRIRLQQLAVLSGIKCKYRKNTAAICNKKTKRR